MHTDGKQTKLEQMTNVPVGRLLLTLSIPAVLSMMITNIYNTADTAFVGMLGTSQSAATGIVFSYMSILQAIAFMCGQGAGSILSRSLGRKDLETATKYASTGFFLSFALGLLLCFLTMILMDPLLLLLGSTQTILPHARTYITCIALAAPFYCSSYTLNNLLRYEGKARLGTIGMMTGALLNIALDPLLMFVLNLGIAGAGIATAVSQAISFTILISSYLRGKTDAKIHWRKISHSLHDIFGIVASGSPSLLRQGFNSVSGMMLNNCAAAFGDAAVSAFSCVNRIGFFSMAIAIGIGQGFQPISSFNYGAGNKQRVRKAFSTATIAQVTVLAILAIPMVVFAPQLIALLRNDPEVVEIGTRALRLLSIANLSVPLTMMTEMGFQSIGWKLYALIGSSLRSGIIFIPCLMILPQVRGLAGLQEAQPLSFLLSAFVAVYLCRIYLKEMQ